MRSIEPRTRRTRGRAALAGALVLLFLLAGLCPPGAKAETREASFRPWSGYWWPDWQGGLGTGLDYRGRPAPLEKYSLLTGGTATGTALTQYLAAHYDPNAPAWWGLCAHWARAASTENIDVVPSSEDNIVFRVGDKKGLLTLAHSNDIGEIGNGIEPDVFHLWLLKYIKDEGKPFVADLWTGEEVWSYPVYRYDMTSSVSGSVESVEVTIYFADDAVAPDYRGTLVHPYHYTYDLFLGAGGAIVGGQWTGASVVDHPELLSISLGVGTGFPGLDYQEVRRIAASRDDFLEHGGTVVDIGPGTYNLILLDEDLYRIHSAAGDILSIRVEKQPGSQRDIEAAVTDGSGTEVHRAVVTNGAPLDLRLTAAAPPYTLRLTQSDYTDPNIYLLRTDVKRSYDQVVPYLPKSGDWSGFALTNTGAAAVERVTLTTQTRDGVPLQTVLGPLRLDPGEKRVFLFDALGVRRHELSETSRLNLEADGPVEMLNLIGGNNRYLSTFVQGNARGTRLVIPDTAPALIPGLRMFGAVRNESFDASGVTLRLYAGGGSLLAEAAVSIAGRGWLPIESGSPPFYAMPQAGWIEILGDGSHLLSGFQYTADSSGVETLFALPVGGGKKIVPHVPEPGSWNTRVTLINPNDQENPVTFHLALAGADTGGDLNIVLAPREKRVVDIQERFGKGAGDPLYRSILEITGRSPLVGYYTYTTGGLDDASFPLLDDTRYRGSLSLPHYPGNDGYWWTGVGVCNPASQAQTVTVEPYDRSGNLLAGQVQTVTLAAGAYEVFEVGARFGQAAAEISFLKFRTEGDTGAIGGFYLYGDAGNQLLSGANM